MRRRFQFLDGLADGMDLPGETVPGLPVVEIGGDRRVLVENHHGVVQYTRERICVKAAYGEICICGCGLELSQMTKQQLVIRGRIDGVTLLRRGK